MQTMGVLNDDEDSDHFLDDDEILDIPTINTMTINDDDDCISAQE